MKIVSLSLLLTLSFSSMAADDARFSENKAKILANVNERISDLQTNKSCIEAASDEEALRKCHEMAKAERKKFKAEMIDKKMKRLEKRKEHLEKQQ